MNSFENILEQTLRKVGGIQPAALGPRDQVSFSREDKRQLLSQLRSQVKFQNKLIIAIVVMHFLLFALAVFLVVYYRDSPSVVITLLGGSVLGLMVIIRSLVNLVRTRSEMDYMLITLPNVPPDQAITVIQSIYFEKKRQKQ